MTSGVLLLFKASTTDPFRQDVRLFVPRIIGGGGGGAGGAEAPLNENLGEGAQPLRFGPENIGNAAENCFGKIFRLVIFSQIVSQWSRLAKYYFLGL